MSMVLFDLAGTTTQRSSNECTIPNTSSSAVPVPAMMQCLASEAGFAAMALVPTTSTQHEYVNIETPATSTYALHDLLNDDGNTLSVAAPVTCENTVAATPAPVQDTLYDVICCRCGSILNLENVHYAFVCVRCRHKRCDECQMRAI